MRGRWLLALVALVSLPGCPHYKPDPAYDAVAPGSLRGDVHDREAACAVEQARGIKIGGLLMDAHRDLDVATRLFESRGRGRGKSESVSLGAYGVSTEATRVLLARRPRAAYTVAARALAHPDGDARMWGLDAIDAVERSRTARAPAEIGRGVRGGRLNRSRQAIGSHRRSAPCFERERSVR